MLTPHSRSFRLKRKESDQDIDSVGSNASSTKKKSHTFSKIFKRRSLSASRPQISSVQNNDASPSRKSKHKLSIDFPSFTNGNGNGNGRSSNNNNSINSRMGKSKSVPNNLSIDSKGNRTYTINGGQLDLTKMPKLPPVQSIKSSKTKREEFDTVRRKLIGDHNLTLKNRLKRKLSRNGNNKANHDEEGSDAYEKDDEKDFTDEEEDDEEEEEEEEEDDDDDEEDGEEDEGADLDTQNIPHTTSFKGKTNNINDGDHHHGFFKRQNEYHKLNLPHRSKSTLRLQSSTPNNSDDDTMNSKPQLNSNTTTSTNPGFFSSLINTFNLKSFTDLNKTRDDNSSISLDTNSIHSTLSSGSENNLQSNSSGNTPALSNSVNFVPVKKALITTLGQGFLTLDSFPKNETHLLDQEHNKVIVDNNALSRGYVSQQTNNIPHQDDRIISSIDDLHNSRNNSSTSLFKSSDENLKPQSLTRESRAKSSLSPIPRKSTLRNPLAIASLSDDEINRNSNRINITNNNGNPSLPYVPSTMSHTVSFKKKLKLPLSSKRQSTDINLSRYNSNADENNNDYNESKPKVSIFEKLDLRQPSDKRQDSFHSLFPNLSSDELLIEDFTCAFKKEILIQGKLYLSEHHICFHSNIIGLVTHLAIPLNAILKMQKKRTVGIPNSMEFSNLHNKYVFATFLSRDATYELIHKIWKININNEGYDTINLDIDDEEVDSLETRSSHSYEDEDDYDDFKKSNGQIKTDKNNDDDTSDTSISDPENMVKEDDLKANLDQSTNEAAKDDNLFNGFTFEGPKTHPETSNGYVTDSSETKIIDVNINAPIGLVYSLMFGDDVTFMKNLLKIQKNFDIGDIPKFSNNKRVYQYTKPVNGGPVGPKQTKCIVEEVVEKKDFNKFCLVVQLTESPDVPSGNSFKVRTKVFLSWAPNNATKLFIVTTVVWSGKSWIKGAIEKGAISGQKEALGILVNELNKKITAGGVNGFKPKKKDKKKQKEEVIEEISEAEIEVQPEPEIPKSYMDMIIEQIDLKLILILILFIFMIVDKSKLSKQSTGYELYSNDRMLISESDLWDWIEQRESILPKGVYNSIEHSEIIKLEKIKSKKPKESLKNIAKRKMSEQELKDTIGMMEQQLSALKEKSKNVDSLL